MTLIQQSKIVLQYYTIYNFIILICHTIHPSHSSSNIYIDWVALPILLANRVSLSQSMRDT